MSAVSRYLPACRPEIIYHAAFKHVSLTEMKPFAVVQNNVFATSTLALLAQRFDVARLIMISTDKAVTPESIMGASKRLAELVRLSMPASAACMGSIRLGNVLGSEGSVVPLFLEQIARGRSCDRHRSGRRTLLPHHGRDRSARLGLCGVLSG